jgi:hypothetical protein
LSLSSCVMNCVMDCVMLSVTLCSARSLRT